MADVNHFAIHNCIQSKKYSQRKVKKRKREGGEWRGREEEREKEVQLQYLAPVRVIEALYQLHARAFPTATWTDKSYRFALLYLHVQSLQNLRHTVSQRNSQTNTGINTHTKSMQTHITSSLSFAVVSERLWLLSVFPLRRLLSVFLLSILLSYIWPLGPTVIL